MRRLVAVLGMVALVAVSTTCGDGGGGAQPAGTARARTVEVTSTVVRDATTQDVLVVAPKEGGPWPVVIVMHGIGGTAADMTALATHLASRGVVVFAPTYRSDLSTQEGIDTAARDGECGYRFARTIAADHGGDLDRPLTFVGWSLGASFVLALGLTEEIDPAREFVTCFTEVPRADVVVAISGCHYEYQGNKTGYLDMSEWGNRDAHLTLVAGENDTTCAAWQSKDAAGELRAAGYDVDLVVLPGASHEAPVFRDRADPDGVAGDKTVEVILDAIADASTKT